MNPAECALSGADGLKSLAVRAPSDRGTWPTTSGRTGSRTNSTPASKIDAIIDVGFVRQEHDHPSGVPYIFLYNAPLHDEADQIKSRSRASAP